MLSWLWNTALSTNKSVSLWRTQSDCGRSMTCIQTIMQPDSTYTGIEWACLFVLFLLLPGSMAALPHSKKVLSSNPLRFQRLFSVGVYTFSMCLHGFSLGPPAFYRSPKTSGWLWANWQLWIHLWCECMYDSLCLYAGLVLSWRLFQVVHSPSFHLPANGCRGRWMDKCMALSWC